MKTKEPSPEQITMWSQLGVQGRAAEIARLKPVLLELARKAGDDGVTIGDLRIVAVQRGLISDNAKGRELAYLGALPKACGLIPTERFRRSIIERSHGNLHRVHVLSAEKRQAVA